MSFIGNAKKDQKKGKKKKPTKKPPSINNEGASLKSKTGGREEKTSANKTKSNAVFFSLHKVKQAVPKIMLPCFSGN